MATSKPQAAELIVITQEDRDTYARLDAIVEDGLNRADAGWRDAIAAAEQMRESKAYRAEYITFEAWCNAKFQRTRQSINQDISLLGIAAKMENAFSKTEFSKAQLAALSKVDAEQQIPVWLAAEKAAESDGKTVTAARIKTEADKLTKTGDTVSNQAHEAESKQTGKQGAKQTPKQNRSNLLPEASAQIFQPDELATLRQSYADLKRDFEALAAENKALKARIAELEAQEVVLANLQAAVAAHKNDAESILSKNLEQLRTEWMAASNTTTKQQQKPSRRVSSKGAEKTAPGADDRQAETGRNEEAALPVNAPTTPTPKAGPPYPPLTTADGTPYPRTVTMYPQGDARRRSQEIAFIRSLRSAGNGSRRETAVLA